jgi:outer membrane murein-binding lipoprotein Lpp
VSAALSNKINESASLAVDLADRARGLASRADALAAEIAALHHDIRAAGREPVRRAGFRCDTAAGSVRQVSADGGQWR